MQTKDVPFTCRFCGREQTGSPGRRYCSDQCRSYAYRRRKYRAGLIRTRSGWKDRESRHATATA